MALGSTRGHSERRLHPDRRSGIDRRKHSLPIQAERRSNTDRRQLVRRTTDKRDGATLLEKAKARHEGIRKQPPTA